MMLLRSIRSRLIVLVLATVVPFMALIGAGLWDQWRSDKAAARARSIDEARVLAAQVDDHLGNVEYLLSGLSRAVSWDPADTAANDALLAQLKSELPDFVGSLLLFSVDGKNIGTSSDPSPGRVDPHARLYFQRALAGEPFAIGDVIRTQHSGHWVVTVATAVRDPSGNVRAVLAVGTRLAHFQEAMRMERLAPGSVVRVVDETGIVIAQSDDPLRWIGRDLAKEMNVSDRLSASGASAMLVWPDGARRITASSPVHLAPWLVSVGVPADAALAAVMSRLGWSALYCAIALALACTIAWTLSGHILRPLHQLRRDAAVLASGELSHRSAVCSNDEVGSLASTLNRMAERLEHRRDEASRAADELRQANDTLAAVIDASPVAIICSDLKRRIFVWNRAAEAIFGYSAEEVLSSAVDVVPPEALDEVRRFIERTIKGETVRDVHVQRRRKDGTLVDVRLAAARMTNPDGTLRGIARAYEDITDRKLAEQQLERLAHYDQLTGLPNRLSLQKRLGSLLGPNRAEQSTAIALFDLDGFKDVNDTLGHSTGDQLLVEVGRRLTERALSSGEVFRLGGDEFVAVFPGCGDPLKTAKAVEAALKALSEPFIINDQVVHIGGSAGVAIAPVNAVSIDELIANADLALYQAKSEGGRVCRLFQPVLRAQAQARRSLQLELRHAFEHDEFELHFQPQVRLADESVVGAEALIRWRHRERGLIFPGAFIDTLGASTIAPEVSRWIIRSACEHAARWREAGLSLKRIGLNLFPIQLGNGSLIADIDEALRDFSLAPEMLELEITENVALDFKETELLQKLRDKGVKLAFDDFGTGYASLSYLLKFPLSRIKIDRSFISRITENGNDAAIVRSLIAMAHNLRLEAVAEGVETAAQAAFLLNERCEEAQGYFYAEPLPAADFEAYLRGKRRGQSATRRERVA
ncbi:MAG TPA: EAL domain-containing protein [Xanthobacteraceae bacterium]|jgi:diguanylate cyclase (GGDEF)-like protein/PAS domain S-box-containing protein